MTASIFISFSSHDRKAAETICKAVEQRGLECWISSRDIGPGENFQEAITRAIRSAKVMILVFSANANNSLEVKKEIALAGHYNVIVVPVRVEDVVPNDALTYELAVRQWIDLFDDWETAIERLVRQLSSVTAPAEAAEPTAPQPNAAPAPPRTSVAPEQARARRRSTAPVIGALAILLIAVAAGAAWYFWPRAPSATAIASPEPAAPNPAPSAAGDTAATGPGSLREALRSRLAAALPQVQERLHDGSAQHYAEGPAHKAQAVPENGAGHWQSVGRASPEEAVESALEGCQVQFGQLCMLTAVDNAVQPVGADRKWAPHDMPRARYAGEFDPVQIPANDKLRERADVLGYHSATAPKAAAYHPDRGRLFIVTGAASQYAAEEEAMKRCDDDPLRNGAGGPCFLYAVDNRVVLPLRLRQPMSEPPQVAAASPPVPTPAAATARPVAAMPRPAEARPRSFRDCPNCPEMVVVPAGRFEMGAADGEEARFEVPPVLAGFERPRHEVTIAKPFALAKFEVTRGEFAAFVKAMNFHIAPGCVSPAERFRGRSGELSWENPGFPQTERDPVVCVNGADIAAYVEWLRKATGKPYRLPAEAEFEYATRGGTTTPFYWGADPDRVCEYENIADQTAAAEFKLAGFTAMPCRDGYVQTAPVGSFKPNPFGLFDMLGNVWEVTADCWSGSYADAPADGSPRTSGDCGMRAARKASFGNGRPYLFRAAHRFSEPAGAKRNHSGFRVALSLE